MCKNKKIKRFIASAKICSSKIAHRYVTDLNHGKETEADLNRLLLLRSFIKTLESCAGIARRTWRGCECETICVKTCLSKKEICIIANKIKTICKNC